MRGIPPADPGLEEYEERGQLIMIPPWLQITDITVLSLVSAHWIAIITFWPPTDLCREREGSDSEFQPEIWIWCMINDLMPDVTWWQYNQCSVRICHKMRCHYFLWLSIESCQVSDPAPSYPEYHNFTLNYWHLCIVIIGGTPGAGWGHKYSLYFA